jgi:hypothetical protein
MATWSEEMGKGGYSAKGQLALCMGRDEYARQSGMIYQEHVLSWVVG